MTTNELSNQENNKVYIALDILGTKFNNKAYDSDSKGVVIVGVFSVLYLIVVLFGFNVMLSYTPKSSKVLLILFLLVIYLIVAIRLTSIFIFKEKEMLKAHDEQVKYNNVSIAPYWNIKSINGFEECTNSLGKFHKVMYRDGKEVVFVKLRRASITGRPEYGEDMHRMCIANFKNILLKEGFSHLWIIDKEHTERLKIYSEYEKAVLNLENEELLFLMNEIITYNQLTTSMVSNVMVDYVIIIAQTQKQKMRLTSILPDLERALDGSAFRPMEVLDKSNCLTLIKDLALINYIDLNVGDKKDRIPVGETFILNVYDIEGNLIRRVNEPTQIKLDFIQTDDINIIKAESLQVNKPKINKKQNDETIVSNIIPDSLENLTTSTKVIEKLSKRNIPNDFNLNVEIRNKGVSNDFVRKLTLLDYNNKVKIG